MNRPAGQALLHRIHRHTLLLASTPVPPRLFPSKGVTVQAHLLAPGSDLPFGSIVDQSPPQLPVELIPEFPAILTSRRSPPPSPLPIPTADPRSQAAVIPPIQAAPSPLLRPLVKQPSVPGSDQVVQPPSEEPSRMDDSTWARLKNIFNRHQEQSVPPPPADALQEILPQQAAPAQRTPETLVPPTPGHLPVDAAERSSEAETVQRNITAPSDRPGLNLSPGPVQPARIATPPPLATFHPPPPLDSSEITPPSDLMPNIAHLPVRSHHPAVDAVEIESDAAAADELPTQPLPLQEIWPVQSTPTQRTPIPSAQDVSLPTQDLSSHAPLSFEQLPTMPGVDSSRVHAILQGIAPAQPSDSHIEVIPPRAPRPSLPADEALPALTRPEPVVQRSQADGPQPSTGGQPAAMSAILPSASVQPNSISPPATVETPFGNLPADLWTLIGETAPGQPVLRQWMDSTPSPDRTPDAPVDSSLIVEETSPTWVQREAEQQVASASSSPTTSRSSTSEQAQSSESTPPSAPAADQQSEPAPEAQSTAGRIDTDELARRVYSQLRRRLAVEWERLRQR